jgi:hypothetical protein
MGKIFLAVAFNHISRGIFFSVVAFYLSAVRHFGDYIWPTSQTEGGDYFSVGGNYCVCSTYRHAADGAVSDEGGVEREKFVIGNFPFEGLYVLEAILYPSIVASFCCVAFLVCGMFLFDDGLARKRL